MSLNRRFIHYAAFYKKTIILALVMLALAVTAELTGPFIAKTMIDKHILGIEQTWYTTPGPGPDAVPFRGHWYKRGDYFVTGEGQGAPVRVIQVGRSFYFVNRSLPFDGSPTAHDGELTLHRGQDTLTVAATQLSRQELFAFYKPELPRMWKLALIYVGLLIVSSVFTYGQRLLLEISANRIIQRMRRNVFRQIHRLPIHYFDNMPAGKVVSRITNDTEAIRDFYVTVLANVFSSIIYMTGIYVALFILDVRLALFCFLLVPILVVWVILYRKYAVTINHQIRALLSDINAMINETIQGMPVIRAFNRQQRTLEEFEALNNRQYKNQTKLLGINAGTSHNLANVLRNVFFIALISYFGWRSFHLAGAISFGALYAFVDYLNRLFQPVVQIVNQLSNLEQARVSAERVFELLDEPGSDVMEGEMEKYRGDVVFDQVFFTYDGKADVLKGISFEARQGQTVALVGHTGSGKSSIMNLLFRFYDARAGRITIDGMDITELPRQHLRKHMGIVLQDPFLFTGTIASNVSLQDAAVPRDRVEQALCDVGAERLLGHLPNGWDEPVLEKGSTLSAGQRQLVSFARALAFDPAILVLDEATSSIDTETEAVIQDALEVVKRGRTTFIIAHRLSTIRSADLILVLDQGVIVERGSHDELMAMEGRYYQMYQLQQGERVRGAG
jgi:ATP-binding cassette, subfamily B, multidrug efflux pump